MASSARLLYTHRKLLWRVTLNDIWQRYAGSILGFGWAIVSPMILLAFYAAIYLVIFRVRAVGLTPISYTLYIFAGMVPFLATSESLSFGIPSIITNKAVLSNTVFPIDLAPAKAVLMSQPTMVVGMTAILVGSIINGNISWTAIFFPFVWALQILALIGLTWVLSLLNIVFRDLQNMIQVIMMMLMVASPIAYTPDMVPEKLQFIISLNPFAYFVIAYQKLLILGEIPTLFQCIMLVVIAFGFFAIGNWIFPRAKKVMIDYVG